MEIRVRVAIQMRASGAILSAGRIVTQRKITPLAEVLFRSGMEEARAEHPSSTAAWPCAAFAVRADHRCARRGTSHKPNAWPARFVTLRHPNRPAGCVRHRAMPWRSR